MKNSESITFIQQTTFRMLFIAILATTVLLYGQLVAAMVWWICRNKEQTDSTSEGAVLGLVRVTINFGNKSMNASIRPIKPDVGYNLTRPGGDNTIQYEPIAVGSFTRGVRGSGGVRYFYATFKVRNAHSNGNAYQDPLENLTFLAVDTDETYGKTPIGQLRLFNGHVLNGSDAINLAEQIAPTGRVERNPQGEVRIEFADVLQVYKETAVDNFSDPDINTVFPYGFVVRSPNTTPHKRKLSGNPDSGQFDGRLTIAYKIPLQVQANQDPFEISVVFLAVDDSEERLTQSIQGQTKVGNNLVKKRVQQLNPAIITVLPGSVLPGFISSTPIKYHCKGVRVAGADDGANEKLLWVAPVFSGLKPKPYGNNRSSIDNKPVFKAAFNKSVNSANTSTFVVRSRQHGIITNIDYSGGTTVSAATTASFAPGELVEVTLTRGLVCRDAVVAQYRVEVAGGNGQAIFSVDNTITTKIDQEASTIELGYIVGSDNILDLVIGNGGGANNTADIFKGTGNGSFSLVTEIGGSGDASSITAGDFNNDGKLELAITNSNDDNVDIVSGGSIISTIDVGEEPKGVDIGNIDGDGDLDMIVANKSSNYVSVLLNDGNFSEENRISVGTDEASAVALGDYNNDGILDLAVVRYGGGNDVLIFEGTGQDGEFLNRHDVNVGTNPNAIVAGDLNGDGNLDLAVTNSGDNNVSILIGAGDGTFTSSAVAVGSSPSALALGDLNGDGDLDIAVTNKGDDTVEILLNSGGSFTSNGTISVGTRPIDLTVGDIDGNGSLDIAVANHGTGGASDSSVSILINQ